MGHGVFITESDSSAKRHSALRTMGDWRDSRNRLHERILLCPLPLRIRRHSRSRACCDNATNRPTHPHCYSCWTTASRRSYLHSLRMWPSAQCSTICKQSVHVFDSAINRGSGDLHGLRWVDCPSTTAWIRLP